MTAADIAWFNAGQIRWNVLDREGLIKVSNEASLRDGLALRAYCAGWDVATEVDLGAWGRIDVLATNWSETLVIEAKLEARTAKQIRAACNQVTGYAGQVEGVGYRRPLVVALRADLDLASTMTKSIPVEVVDPNMAIAYMKKHGDVDRATFRLHEMAGVRAVWGAWLAEMPPPAALDPVDELLDEFPDAETLGDLTRDKR